MAQNGTLFTTDSASSQVTGSVDFVKDSFVDTVLEASDNTGLTSNALTNPFGVFVANAEAVQYGVKTLWIKGIELLEDRSKWINSQPTYQVLFHENYPGLFCYAALRTSPNANDQFYEPFRLTNPDIKPFYLGSDDNWTFGVTGRFRRIAFLTGKAGITGRLFLDGVDSGAISYMNVTTQASSGPYQMFCSPAVHGASNLTDDIHDVRIAPTAATSGNPSIFGIQVFFENSGANIQVGPGISYVDKIKLESTSGASYTVPAFGNSMGGVALYTKTNSGAYATFLTSVSTLSTIAQGAVDTNLLSVSSGHGASYPSGTGFVVDQGGGSYYVGSVISVSTDTLTVGPTLPFGVSGTLERRWSAGYSLPIGSSIFYKAFTWEPDLSFGSTATQTVGDQAVFQNFYDPISNIGVYALGGFTGSGGIPILSFRSGGTDYLQCSGDFSAAEVEWSGLCFTNAISVEVNGRFGFTSSVQLGDGFDATGSTIWMSRMTMFTDAGVGVNEFKLNPGTTLIGAGIRRVNFYKYNYSGATVGFLGTLERNQAYAAGSSIALGLDRRVPSTYFGYTGSWGFDYQEGPTNSRAIVTGSNAGSFKYQFYGKNFQITGQAGQSSVLTLDGLSIPPTFNQMTSVASEGWHEIEYQHKAGTGSGGRSLIKCIDYARSFREVKQLQNTKAVPKRKVAIPIIKDFGNTVLGVLGDTSNPTKGTLEADRAHVRREGRYLVIDYTLIQTAAGAPGSGDYYIPIPFGLRVDPKYQLPTSSSRLASSVGSFFIYSSDALASIVGQLGVLNNRLYFWGRPQGTTEITSWGSAAIAMDATNIEATFNARIPILGWDDYEYIEVNDG